MLKVSHALQIQHAFLEIHIIMLSIFLFITSGLVGCVVSCGQEISRWKSLFVAGTEHGVIIILRSGCDIMWAAAS